MHPTTHTHTHTHTHTRYCTKCNVSEDDVEFVYGIDKVIDCDQTPASLKISDGATIEVRPKQRRRDATTAHVASGQSSQGVLYTVPHVPGSDCLVYSQPKACAEVIGYVGS